MIQPVLSTSSCRRSSIILSSSSIKSKVIISIQKAQSRLFQKQKQHIVLQCQRSFAVYVSGHAWTGALGTGFAAMTDRRTHDVSDDDRENCFTEVTFSSENDAKGVSTSMDVVCGASGWGHTALVVAPSSSDREKEARLWIAGRPYDFQKLLRLKRLPSFLRRGIVGHSLRGTYSDDGGKSEGWLFDKWMDGLLYLGESYSKSNDEKKDNLKTTLETRQDVFPYLTDMALPNGDVPLATAFNPANPYFSSKTLAASAGVTAVIGKSGTLYTFGLNHRGQCGIGRDDVNHVWTPTPVKGLSTLVNGTNGDNDPFFSKEDRSSMEQDCKIVQVSLGLQHGLALDERGRLFAWGKGGRGQLGVYVEIDEKENEDLANREAPDVSSVIEYAAIHVSQFVLPADTDEGGASEIILSGEEARVTSISSGLNHSAAVTNSNHAWIWGKNVKPILPLDDQSTSSSSKLGAIDAVVPTLIQGLPHNLKILDISCGSHHTAILMEDGSVYAIGVATDNVQPIVDRVVEMIPAGLIDMPIRQFVSHFDRTTIVAGVDGRQILEVQLWSEETLRENGVFEPAWVNDLLFDGTEDCNNVKEGALVGSGSSNGVRMIHRGWLHSLVITDS